MLQILSAIYQTDVVELFTLFYRTHTGLLNKFFCTSSLASFIPPTKTIFPGKEEGNKGLPLFPSTLRKGKIDIILIATIIS